MKLPHLCIALGIGRCFAEPLAMQHDKQHNNAWDCDDALATIEAAAQGGTAPPGSDDVHWLLQACGSTTDGMERIFGKSSLLRLEGAPGGTYSTIPEEALMEHLNNNKKQQYEEPLRRLVALEVVSYTATNEATLTTALTTVGNAGKQVEVEMSFDNLELTAEQFVDVSSSALVQLTGASTTTTTTLVAAAGERLITVGAAASLELSDLVLANGTAYGTYSLTDYEGRGGCVIVLAGATLKASATKFVGCAAYVGGAVSAHGAASVITLELGSVVAHSSSLFSGGCVSATGGAALYVKGDSIVRDCVAGYLGGCVSGFDAASFESGSSVVLTEGAAVFNCAAVYGAAGSAPVFGLWSVTDSTLTNSTASLGGGGVLHVGGSTHLYSNAKIQNCVAAGTSKGTGGGGIFGYSIGVPASCVLSAGSSITRCSAGFYGGGIYAETLHSFVLEGGSYISDCTSGDGGGGAAFKLGLELKEGSHISRCTSTGGFGGAIFMLRQNDVVKLTDAALVDNHAMGGGGGGGIAAPKGSKVYLLRSTLTGNSAPSGIGGAVASAGGQVWIMAGTVLQGNSAKMGGAVALSTSFHPEWTAGGSLGRLYVSGPSCAFLQTLIDFSAVTDFARGSLSYGVVDTLAGAAAENTTVDARGISGAGLIRATSGQITEAELCLVPGRDYRMALTAVGGGSHWSGAAASHFGPLQTTTADSEGDLAVPDGATSWELRFATSHAFRLAADSGRGGRVLIRDNEASESGGALFVANQGRAFAVEVDFENNMAMGVAEAGGAVFLDTSTRMEAVDCGFRNNSAPEGRGGGMQAKADCVVSLRGSEGLNNTAKTAGGFGFIQGSAELKIEDSTFAGNSLAAENTGGRGGALALENVGQATLTRSLFAENAVLAARNDGGALAASDSALSLEGTVFSDNVAALGNGGGLALEGTTTLEWVQGAAPCVRTEMVVDYTATDGTCAQEVPEATAVSSESCDYAAGRCASNAASLNPYTADTLPLCGGCSCPFDEVKYFTLRQEATGNLSTFFNLATGAWSTKGNGYASSVYRHSLCLEAGDYSFQAVDGLGQGWWGAQLSARVFPTAADAVQEVHDAEAWTGFNSTRVFFTVASDSDAVASNALKGNRAPLGGGGGLYWTRSGAEEPVGLADLVMLNNNASYGDHLATDATSLLVKVGGEVFFSDDDDDEEEVTVPARSSEAVRPSVSVEVVDYYSTVVAADSTTVILARVASATVGLSSTQGSVEIVDRGVATYSTLAFETNQDGVDLDVVFSAPLLVLDTAGKPLKIVVELPSKPTEELNELGGGIVAFLLLLILLTVGFSVYCMVWTYRLRKRVILRLSQPKMLYALCAGCAISAASSLPPIVSDSTASCQLNIWLYGFGFVVQTATLYIKMQQMEKVIEHSLQMTSKKVKMNRVQIFKVMIIMAAGEILILGGWLVLAPLEYKRSCTEREKGGPWDGTCIESVGKCRTTHGEIFVGLISLWHALCVLAGMYMCYKVRNLPSIMAEGKWVFTSFYSQLQVFVTAVPVLFMVKDDAVTFTLLKSLVVAIGVLTTLSMIYLPKMLLVSKYYDFDSGAISRYISSSMTTSTQKDTVYEQLKVKDGGKRSASGNTRKVSSSTSSEGGRAASSTAVGSTTKKSASPPAGTRAFAAAKNGDVKELEKILKENPKEIDKPSTAAPGNFLVHAAAEAGQPHCLKLVISKAAKDSIDLVNNDGATPAFLAAKNGHVDALKILIDAGCDLSKQAKDGATPASVAEKFGLVAITAAIDAASLA